MELNVKLEAFEGPLDLLLHLIDKNKVNIYDIPIVEITDQYMAYIEEAKRRDLNIMSEFLVMAATLLSIKSKMLLPKSEDPEVEEEDPRAELVQQLLEYKMYKYMAYELRDRQVDANQIFYKAPTIPKEVLDYEQPVDLEQLIGDLSLQKLNDIFQSVLRRQKNRVDPIRSKFGEIVQEEVSVEEKTEYMTEFVSSHKRFSFKDLLERQGSKMEVIVTFLVILEFMKAGIITIRQEKIFDDIEVESLVAA
ncbi:MAG: segregation/condensation protein A [Lachnospiraceae bacterium]|nr:segregation/condensation protein A [Lachnospiraceae bacterium]